MPVEIVLASGNRGKLRELTALKRLVEVLRREFGGRRPAGNAR